MATINSWNSNIPVEVTKGGTGAATLTDHGVILGSGTAAVTILAAAATGSGLMGNTGADPSFTGSPSFSGTVTAGTGLSVTTGDAAVVAGNLTLPVTTVTTGAAGVIEVNSVRFMHSVGTDNTFLGSGVGNFTLSGTQNTIIGKGAGVAITTSSFNTVVGEMAFVAKTSGGFNVSIGSRSMESATDGGNNTVIGHAGTQALTTGSRNVVIGTNAMLDATTASTNVAIGSGGGGATPQGPLKQLDTGDFNIAIGCSNNAISTGPGFAYTGAESSNICLGGATVGVNAESNVMRLGTHGAGDGQVDKCFIAGVRGITTANADAVAVLVDSAHQFGTVSSSIRVKKNVEDMGNATGDLFSLRPVLFDYINSPSHRRQYGLIAEEVEKIMPDLVVYDKDQLPETVRYLELPVMLLNEMKKLRDRIVELESKLGE